VIGVEGGRRLERTLSAFFVRRCTAGVKNWTASTVKQPYVRSAQKSMQKSVYIVMLYAAMIA
jgi:hypothetical protein